MAVLVYGHSTSSTVSHFTTEHGEVDGRKEDVVKIGFVTYFLTRQGSVCEFLEWAAINLVIFARSSINNVTGYHLEL